MAHIYQYTKDNRNNPVGVVVALKNANGEVWVGHSRANRSKGDEFNRDRGLDIALDRALKRSIASIPPSMAEDVLNMANRAARYFKVAMSDVHVCGTSNVFDTLELMPDYPSARIAPSNKITVN